MRKLSISIRCVTGRFALQAPWSTFPRTAWTGASAPSLASTSGLPTSPAWMMGSQPASAASACGRSRPWVSEIAPMVRIMPDQPTRGAACAGSPVRTAAFDVIPAGRAGGRRRADGHCWRRGPEVGEKPRARHRTARVHHVARRCGDLCLLVVQNFLPDGCEDIFLLLTIERVSFDEPL